MKQYRLTFWEQWHGSDKIMYDHLYYEGIEKAEKAFKGLRKIGENLVNDGFIDWYTIHLTTGEDEIIRIVHDKAHSALDMNRGEDI